MTVTGLAQHPDLRKWQVDLLINGNEGNATFMGWSDSLPRWAQGRVWGDMLTFDSSQYPNGTHQLRLRVVKLDGNYDEYLRTIVIRN